MMKEIPGFSKQYATEDGRIFSCRSGTMQEKPQRLDTKGYLRVNLRDNSFPVKNKQVNVHTAVLLAFVGAKPNGMECRHLNGNCLDNRLENLCWGTHKENIQDQLRHGTAICLQHGDNHVRSKLHYTDVYAIVELYRRGYLQREIADAFLISQRHVSDIINHKTWCHLWA